MRDLPIATDETAILTIGYEKSDVATFVRRLVEAGVEVLVDVRDRPLSRKPGFSKNALRAAVEAAGLEYLHVKALGDPKPGRDAARAGDHERFVRIFQAHMETNEALDALGNLADGIAGRRICLTCFERSHEACHRTMVAASLAAATGAPVEHLTV